MDSLLLRFDQRPHDTTARYTDRVKEPGAILLVACYELGHQPLAVAWPAAFLERAGYAPAVRAGPLARAAGAVATDPPRPPRPVLESPASPAPSRAHLPAPPRSAHVEKPGRPELPPYAGAGRGGKLFSRHCPIPPVYGG